MSIFAGRLIRIQAVGPEEGLTAGGRCASSRCAVSMKNRATSNTSTGLSAGRRRLGCGLILASCLAPYSARAANVQEIMKLVTMAGVVMLFAFLMVVVAYGLNVWTSKRRRRSHHHQEEGSFVRKHRSGVILGCWLLAWLVIGLTFYLVLLR
jgi:hypothetical protein